MSNFVAKSKKSSFYVKLLLENEISYRLVFSSEEDLPAQHLSNPLNPFPANSNRYLQCWEPGHSPRKMVY